MSEEGQPFNQIKLNENFLKDCKLGIDCNESQYRLYYLPIGSGFEAIALEFVSCDADVKNMWEHDSLMVNELFRVTAYFDGVRHFGVRADDDQYSGYIYYPSIPGFIKLLQKVRDLEELYCSEVQKERVNGENL